MVRMAMVGMMKEVAEDHITHCTLSYGKLQIGPEPSLDSSLESKAGIQVGTAGRIERSQQRRIPAHVPGQCKVIESLLTFLS